MIFPHILVLNFFSTLIPLLSQQPRDCPEENWDKYRENISNISKKYQEHSEQESQEQKGKRAGRVGPVAIWTNGDEFHILKYTQG